MKHVYVIDDNALIRETLGSTLTRLGYTTEIYRDPIDFLQQSMPVSPAVILLDMQMPFMSGVTLQQRLLEIGRKTPIIFVSGESQSNEIVRAMKQGALDFLFKPFNLDELLAAIELGLEKDSRQSTLASENLSLRARFECLTPREKEVCSQLVQGLLSKTIAVNLGISNATIKVHKARIMEKMQVKSLQQLALCMEQLGLT
jgi:two-component system response regulator FixJ